MIRDNLLGAIRGPVMLITVGTLFALDHLGTLSFDRTWPAIIIVFGLMKLLERVGAPAAGPAPREGNPQ